MKREDAYYYKLLLATGINDGYMEWLDSFLEKENPLSDIVLELSFCGNDTEKIISVLGEYSGGQDLDEKYIVEKLRLFFKEAYHSGAFSKKETVKRMYRLTMNHEDPGGYNAALWDSMFYLDTYYSDAECGIISWKTFDRAFFSYLDAGIPVIHSELHNILDKPKKTLFDKIIYFFKKKT